MYQSFNSNATPEAGPERLARLRAEMTEQGLNGFLVPRADAHQGEYVAPCDARLAWLTGFTGSAGFAAILADQAGVFVDGRYRVQVRAEVATDVFTPVPWPETKLADWLIEALPNGGVVGFDPWLYTSGEIAKLKAALQARQISLRAVDNLVDKMWIDRPARPASDVESYPQALAGATSVEKRQEIAATLREGGTRAAVITLPDSLCWLLNIRGNDLPHLPVVQAFGIIHDTGDVDLFAEPRSWDGAALGDGVHIAPRAAFEDALAALDGPIRLDAGSAPERVRDVLEAAGIEIVAGDDPCTLRKARKTAAEIAATSSAHIRDGAAMARFLHWFDTHAPDGSLNEIDCVMALERFRIETGALRDISFDTIAGAGPHGAIVHYRVTEATNAPLLPGQLFLIDSGGQYLDGTTDVTRTLPIGAAGETERTAFTQVLRGMIAVSMARFPKGVAGRDLDALARAPLWAAGRDYDHGTGHGVGVYLSVHEGPQRISRASTLPLEEGMILSNEPGYYREGAFGIRIENLIVVTPKDMPEGGDEMREMLGFETLTWVPIDRRLIDREAMTGAERAWLNTYHAEVAARIGPHLDADVARWLERATAPI